MQLESISFIHDNSGSKSRQLVFCWGSEVPKHIVRQIDHWKPNHTMLLLLYPLSINGLSIILAIRLNHLSDTVNCTSYNIADICPCLSLHTATSPVWNTVSSLFDVLPWPPIPSHFQGHLTLIELAHRNQDSLYSTFQAEVRARAEA